HEAIVRSSLDRLPQPPCPDAALISSDLMTFLAPLALFGVLLLILPIVVHLFKPRKMKQTPFSSLRWLKQTHQRLSRRIQWHQWLLFLLRAGCIVLLVLALAKPLIGFWGARPVDRFVIV